MVLRRFLVLRLHALQLRLNPQLRGVHPIADPILGAVCSSRNNACANLAGMIIALHGAGAISEDRICDIRSGRPVPALRSPFQTEEGPGVS